MARCAICASPVSGHYRPRIDHENGCLNEELPAHEAIRWVLVTNADGRALLQRWRERTFGTIEVQVDTSRYQSVAARRRIEWCQVIDVGQERDNAPVRVQIPGRGGAGSYRWDELYAVRTDSGAMTSWLGRLDDVGREGVAARLVRGYR